MLKPFSYWLKSHLSPYSLTMLKLAQSGFHPGNRSSIPLGTTIRELALAIFFVL